MDKNTEEFEGGPGGKSSISADLIRGHINTIILRSLYEEDKYGYEIINEINEKSHGQYTLKQPTLYSALKRLENQGYIQAYWKNDEVSAGGRRKYFRLTERGREITERNQAEWEYSRTVIDNLISDKNFDFSRPAPTPVDFKILKQATSRVPVVHDESRAEGLPQEAAPGFETENFVSEEEPTVYVDDPNSAPEPAVVYSSETEKPLAYSEQVFESGIRPSQSERQPEQAYGVEHTETYEAQAQAETTAANDYAERQAQAETTTANDYAERQAQAAATTASDYAERQSQAEAAVPDMSDGFDDAAPVNRTYEQPATNEENPAPQQAQPPFDPDKFEAEREKYTSQLSQQLDEESRRQQHENYMKLISGDDDEKRRSSYDERRESMIYNDRPEEERDYKNLIDKLFENTLKNSEPVPEQPYIQAQQREPLRQAPAPEAFSAEPAQTVRYGGYDEVMKRAASDGIKVTTSEEAFAAGSVKQKTYNKGATLFKCSLIIGIIMLVEFIITISLKTQLGVSVAYPIVILAMGLGTVIVCGILFATRYGTHMRKPVTLKYIITSSIITVILIVVIILFGVIIQTNWTAANEVLANVVIPCIIALNIPVFTLSFYLLTKN